MFWKLLLNIAVFLAATFVGGIIVLYLYFRKRFKYWSERNVPHEKPVFPFGNLVGINKNPFMIVFKRIYDEGKHLRYYGLWQLHRPTLMVNDPELIKMIMVGDSINFPSRGNYINEKDDPLSANVASLEGAAWRNLRVKLTPIFTSGKIKMMFPFMVECGKELQEVLVEPARIGDVVDMKEFAARFAIDVISSAAFGIEGHSLKNPNAVVRQMGRKIFEPTWNILLRNSTTFVLPDLARLLKLKVTPDDVADFFIETFREVIDYRDKNNVRRNDAMQLLIDLYKKGYIEDADNPKKQETDKSKFNRHLTKFQISWF